MNEEVYAELLDMMRQDYKDFVAKFEAVEEANPGLSFAEIDSLVEHGAPKLPEHLQGFELELEEACKAVYVEVTMAAMFGEFI